MMKVNVISCGGCGNKYKEKKDLKNHMRKFHGVLYASCGNKYKTKRDLKIHMRRVHVISCVDDNNIKN